jgi:ribosomal protein L29
MTKRQDSLKALQGRSGADLLKLAHEKRDRLHGLVTDLAAGKVKNVREIKGIKKEIARILTFLRNETK